MSQVKVLLNILHNGKLITAGNIISENDLVGADIEDLLARGLITKNISSEEAETAQTTTEPEAPVEPETPTEPENPEAGTSQNPVEGAETTPADQQSTEETQETTQPEQPEQPVDNVEQPSTETTENGAEQQVEQPATEENAGNQTPVDQQQTQ